MKCLVAIALLGSIGSAYAAPVNPEFQFVQGLMAASGNDLGSSQGRQIYQRQVNGLVQSYSANHTADPSQALNNVITAFQVMGIPDQEVTQIRAVSDRYASAAQASTTAMTTAETQAFWQHYGTDLSTALASVPYPQGAEFSSCQWSLAVMGVGLGVGIPLFAVAIGAGMGDQNAAPIYGQVGPILTLIGLGGLVAVFPTCL